MRGCLIITKNKLKMGSLLQPKYKGQIRNTGPLCVFLWNLIFMNLFKLGLADHT